MNLNFANLFAGFVFGVFGFYLLRIAREKAHVPWIFVGIVMMLYPYFVASTLWTWFIGIGLCGIAYALR